MPTFSIPYTLSNLSFQAAREYKRLAVFDINHLTYKILISGFSKEERQLYDVLRLEQNDDVFNRWYEETFKPVFEFAIRKYLRYCMDNEYNLFTETIEMGFNDIDIVEYYKRIRTANRIIK